jgi:hypothetical protein
MAFDNIKVTDIFVVALWDCEILMPLHGRITIQTEKNPFGAQNFVNYFFYESSKKFP